MGLLQQRYGDEVRAAVGRYPDGRQASAVLRVLYLAQAAYGHLSDAAIAEVAEVLDMSPTHVRGLVGFYTLFYEAPHGGYVLHVCTDLPCALRGADELLDRLCERVGARPGETSADGLFTVEKVMCLAACDRAPVLQVNLEYVYDLTDEQLDGLLDGLRRRAAQPGRRRCPPFGFGPPSEMVDAEPSPDAIDAEAERA
jgi:NADH-quinone oxidoreductase subunit E